MAVAAGLDDTKVVYGYLRVPKDNIDIATRSNGKIKINHAWCAVKIDGTYRLIDCYLASPFLPSNKGFIESHWFLARPLTMIYTHFPASFQDQFLDPPVTSAVFFGLPHVRTPFFKHHLQVLDYEFTYLDLVDDDVLHMTLWMDDATGCYAEVECRLQKTGSTTSAIIIKRALAQFIMDGHQRVCKIKAVLPSDMRVGWLKIYAGPKIWPDVSFLALLYKANSAFNPYPLAMVYRITHSGRPPQVFDFVKSHLSVYDFYVHEPQCYVLYPMQMYTFRILSMVNRHQKLAVKSPTGRLNRLVYFPQDKSYTGSMIVGEVGIWHLVCLQESGSWNNVIASWECRS
ncbi:hypothetical protein BC943DRAFT_279940 [Umbelopsis sp. AD052]|nr:hypothetical protein BC943DRAFT_279940 [Umbelopsis sp. AD052]